MFDPGLRRLIARHEAGHAVAAHRLGRRLHGIEVFTEPVWIKDCGCWCGALTDIASANDPESDAIIALAGPLTQRLFIGSGHDIRRARHAAKHGRLDFGQLLDFATRLVYEHEADIDRVAAALIDWQRLDRVQFLAALV
jgi:hypothetical protein